MMLRYLSAFMCGVLFSAGLLVSQMVNPQKVLGFLDIFGQWDPALLLVMGTALLVYWSCYFVIKPKLEKPILSQAFLIPQNTKLDVRLILGAVLFGIGWGITGLCPGPAIANLGSGNMQTVAYVAIMLLSMFTYERLMKINKQ